MKLDQLRTAVHHEISTRALLEEIATGDPDDLLSFGELLDRFSRRSHGLFLLLVLLPVFIPVPIGVGGICGPMISLIGVQLLLQFEHPWLPGFLARRQFKRQLLIGFQKRFGGWLQRLERLSRPRHEELFDRAVWRAFSGLLLIALGILLALPVPGTNYPFGLIILRFEGYSTRSMIGIVADATAQVEAIFTCAYLIQWNADTFSTRQWRDFAGALAATTQGHLTDTAGLPDIPEWT